jgi:hypothetical protein
MNVEVIWIPQLKIAEIIHHNLTLADVSTIADWKNELSSQLQRLFYQQNQKLPLLICIDRLNIRPQAAELYGKVAHEIVDRFSSKVARYGETRLIQTIISTVALKNNFKANIFVERAHAIEYLQSKRSWAHDNYYRPR